MSLWRHLTRGLRSLHNRDQEIADEVSHYLEESTAAFIARGLTPQEARRAAERELGGATAVREQVRSYGWENTMDTLFADLRYAARRLVKNPGFTAISVLTLGLGIGASTAIFSVVDAVLLRALPYPNAQQIVRVWEQTPSGHRLQFADPNFEDFRTQNDTFARLAEYAELVRSVSGGSEPVRVHIAEVTPGFFETLSVAPFRGRALTYEAPAAIVSYGYWQRYLGASTDLSKFHLTMEGTAYPVIGVMPEGFDYPPGVSAWIPREFPQQPGRTGHNWWAIGRVRDGISVAHARANLSTIARRIKNQYGKDVDLNDAAVVPLADALVGNVRTALLTLLAAVGLLLLVACANVAGLLLARNSARGKELAVRVALGAGRARLIQQFLAESFALSSVGGALGILIATWAVRVLPAILPANLPRQQGVAINTPVLLFALAAILIVAVALGLFAALRASTDALTSGSRSYAGTPASHRLRGVLVIGEIAITLVILIGAGLLGRSFLHLLDASPGFNPRNLVTIEFKLPTPAGHLMEDALTRLRTIPGADTVGVAGAMPVAQGDNLAEGDFIILDGRKPPASFEEFGRLHQNPSQVGHALYALASADYFRTLGIPLIRGRLFAEQDDANATHVALISEALARQRWPAQDPIGRTIDFGNMDGNLKPLTIVGIVGDVRARGIDHPGSGVIYVDYRQRGININSEPTILLRTSAPSTEILSAARAIFHEIAPDVPVKFSTFNDELGGWLADRRFLLLLVGSFAAAALLLAAIGIYGVVAFSVARRTQEIGIRMALGARPADVLRLVVGEGARLAALGVAIGIAASLALTRLLATLLFGIAPTDPVTFATVATLLLLVALLASYIPARRAMRVDPNIALHYE